MLNPGIYFKISKTEQKQARCQAKKAKLEKPESWQSACSMVK
jgi:hypothetical protein